MPANSRTNGVLRMSSGLYGIAPLVASAITLVLSRLRANLSIYASGLRLFAQLKSEMDISFDVTPEGSGFNVGCRYIDGDMTLMDINLYAPDEDQANFIKSKIKMNPTDFYCRVIDYIIENEEYVPSVAEGEDMMLF